MDERVKKYIAGFCFPKIMYFWINKDRLRVVPEIQFELLDCKTQIWMLLHFLRLTIVVRLPVILQNDYGRRKLKESLQAP